MRRRVNFNSVSQFAASFVLLCVVTVKSYSCVSFYAVFSQMFLVALSFAYFAKALCGSYMKSTITQLERRFDIPSYLIGVIDGSFEIGE